MPVDTFDVLVKKLPLAAGLQERFVRFRWHIVVCVFSAAVKAHMHRLTVRVIADSLDRGAVHVGMGYGHFVILRCWFCICWASGSDSAPNASSAPTLLPSINFNNLSVFARSASFWP